MITACPKCLAEKAERLDGLTLVRDGVVSCRYHGEMSVTCSPALLHYTDCGLDGVYLMSGYEVMKTPYGEGVAIKNLDQLHKAIGCHLASQKKVLSGKELRFLRKQMDLTQSGLAKLLGLSSQQVARWEKEESDISGPADLLVRAYYIQHVGGKLDLQTLAEKLDEIDAPMNDKSYFEPTEKGWRPLKKAA